MMLWNDRRIFTPTTTIGYLSIDGVFDSFILEDVVRPPGAPKVKGQTAIPAGEYRVDLTHSPKFGCVLPLLFDVPNFKGVRIHDGGTIGTHEDTEGCLITGAQVSRLGNDYVVFGGKIVLGLLMARMRNAKRAGDKIWIRITESR